MEKIEINIDELARNYAGARRDMRNAQSTPIWLESKHRRDELYAKGVELFGKERWHKRLHAFEC